MWRILVLFGLLLVLTWALVSRPWDRRPSGGMDPGDAVPGVPQAAEEPGTAVSIVQPIQSSPGNSQTAVSPLGIFVLRSPDLRVVLQIKDDGTFFLQSDRTAGGQRHATGTWVRDGARVGLRYLTVNGERQPGEIEPEWSQLSAAGVQMQAAPGRAPLLLQRQEQVSLR